MTIQPLTIVESSGPILGPQPAPAFPKTDHWASWVARREAHDRAVRRNALIALPLLMLITMFMLYVWLQ